MGLLDIFEEVPIVGDILGAVGGHASAKHLQNDAQAHDSHMFIQQVAHAKDMANLQYQKQRDLLKDSPGLQMQGLKMAGLNPILAATGGFKSSTGAGLSIPVARSGGSSASPGTRLQIGQTKLLTQQANAQEAQADMYKAQADKAREETKFVGQATSIAEPIAELMQAIAGLLEQSRIDRGTSERIWEWLISETVQKTEPLTPKQQAEMLDKAKEKFPQLKGVENAKRKIFGGK
jgi:hypothetical protein